MAAVTPRSRGRKLVKPSELIHVAVAAPRSSSSSRLAAHVRVLDARRGRDDAPRDLDPGQAIRRCPELSASLDPDRSGIHRLARAGRDHLGRRCSLLLVPTMIWVRLRLPEAQPRHRVPLPAAADRPGIVLVVGLCARSTVDQHQLQRLQR